MKKIVLFIALLVAPVYTVWAQAVDLPLTVTDGIDTRVLRFGLDPSATDGIDTELGEQGLPPLPPGFEARFVDGDIAVDFGTVGSEGTYWDFRSGGAGFQGTQVHEISYKVGDGSQITISWNLPEGVTGVLEDLLGGIVVNEPMSGQGIKTVDNPGVISKLKITITYDLQSEPSNQTPTITSPANITVAEREHFTQAVQASDDDGEALSFNLSTIPVIANNPPVIDVNGNVSWRPGFDQAATYTFVVTVDDGQGAANSTASATWTVTVTDTNRAPAFTSEPVTVAMQGQVYTYTATTTDPDGDAVSLSAQQKPEWLSFQDNGDGTGILAGTPSNVDVGDHQVVLRADDGYGTTLDQTFTVSIISVNNPPVAVDDSVSTPNETAVTIAVLANDNDPEDALAPSSIAVVSSPSNGTAMVNPNGTITYTPAGAFSGTDTFTYIVQDDEGAVSNAATVTVTVLENPDADADGVDDNVESQAPGDGDGNGDGISDSQQPNVASLPSQRGDFVSIAVPAGQRLRAVQTTSNPAPQTAPDGVDFGLGFLSFDVEGSAPGAAVVTTIHLPPNTQVNTYWKYDPRTDTWYDFLFDGTTGAAFFSDRIELHFVDGNTRGDHDGLANGVISDPGAPGFVQVVNSAPTFIAELPDTTVAEGGSLTFDYEASDADGDALVFIVVSPPAYASIDAATGVLTLAPSFEDAGTVTITAVVSDGQLSDTSRTAVVVVAETNRAPVFTAVLPDSSRLNGGSTLTFQFQATDPDNDPLTFSLLEGPVFASLNGNTGELTAAPGPTESGEYNVLVRVTDGAAADTSNRAVIIVNDGFAISANLAGLNEVPNAVITPGTGEASAMIAGDTLYVQGRFQNLSDEIRLVGGSAAHIHVGSAGENGSIVVSLNVDADADGTGGAIDPANNRFVVTELTFPDGMTVAGFKEALTQGGLFVNVPTQRFPEGELRGQLLRADNAPPQSPAIISPDVGTVVTIGGAPGEDPVDPEVILAEVKWESVSDPDGDRVLYVWQVSLDQSFSDDKLIDSIFSGDRTSFPLTVEDLATVFDLITADDPGGVALGDPVPIYHRVVATDGSLWSAGSAVAVTLVRGTVTDVEAGELPMELALRGNYPNPFNPTTAIAFDLPTTASVSVQIVDMLGRRVMATPGQTMQAGSNRTVQIDASSLTSGTYLYRVIVNTATKTAVKTGKMTLLK